MSQRAFLRQFDGAAVNAFFHAGIADVGAYLSPVALAAIAAHDPDDPEAPPLPTPTSCMVLVDRDVEDFGDDAAPVNVRRTLATFQLREVQPEQGGQVTVDGEAYVLVQRNRADESLSAWWVQHA